MGGHSVPFFFARKAPLEGPHRSLSTPPGPGSFWGSTQRSSPRPSHVSARDGKVGFPGPRWRSNAAASEVDVLLARPAHPEWIVLQAQCPRKAPRGLPNKIWTLGLPFDPKETGRGGMPKASYHVRPSLGGGHRGNRRQRGFGAQPTFGHYSILCYSNHNPFDRTMRCMETSTWEEFL
jgi:hypothetical protein